MTRVACLGMAACLLLASAAGAQQVTLERDSPLYPEPRLDAAPVAQLKQGSSGDVVAKQGAWLQLRTPEAAGWLFSFNVRFPSVGAQGGEGAGMAIGRLLGPRRSTSVTSSIGVRGIEEEDLRQASFNAGQMELLDGYAATKESAEERARGAGLAAENVEFLGADQ